MGYIRTYIYIYVYVLYVFVQTDWIHKVLDYKYWGPIPGICRLGVNDKGRVARIEDTLTKARSGAWDRKEQPKARRRNREP